MWFLPETHLDSLDFAIGLKTHWHASQQMSASVIVIHSHEDLLM